MKDAHLRAERSEAKRQNLIEDLASLLELWGARLFDLVSVHHLLSMVMQQLSPCPLHFAIELPAPQEIRVLGTKALRRKRLASGVPIATASHRDQRGLSVEDRDAIHRVHVCPLVKTHPILPREGI